MKKYEIQYHMYPEEDITIIITAKDEDSAIIYAKQYRRDGFSIREVED